MQGFLVTTYYKTLYFMSQPNDLGTNDEQSKKSNLKLAFYFYVLASKFICKIVESWVMPLNLMGSSLVLSAFEYQLGF